MGGHGRKELHEIRHASTARPSVIAEAEVNLFHVRGASPYFQNLTRRQKACQIDLLIPFERFLLPRA